MIRALEQTLQRGISCTKPEVFYSRETTLSITPALVDWLTEQARGTVRKRSRLCAHPDPQAAVHQMIIVHHNDVYVRPHRHATKAESFHRISGAAAIVLFDNDGAIEQVVEVDGSADSPFYVRIPAGRYHTFVVRSEWLVFLETTAGPFDRSLMEFGPWAPGEEDLAAVERYCAQLRRVVKHASDGSTVEL